MFDVGKVEQIPPLLVRWLSMATSRVFENNQGGARLGFFSPFIPVGHDEGGRSQLTDGLSRCDDTGWLWSLVSGNGGLWDSEAVHRSGKSR